MSKKKETNPIGRGDTEPIIIGYDDGSKTEDNSAGVSGLEEHEEYLEMQKEIDKTAYKDIHKTLADAEKKAEELEKEQEKENPEIDINKMNMIMSNLRDTLILMEDSWKDTKREFKITDDHMRLLYQYNEQNREQMPEGLSEEEQDKFDHFNGLNEIPMDEVIKIFGEEHPIIGVDDQQTRDRIKDSVEEFFNYLAAMREYKQVYIAYQQALELAREEEMKKLAEIMEQTEDPEAKAKMKEALDTYYNNKYLGFLSQMTEKEKNRIIDAYGDKKTIEYWLKRTRDKMYTAKINQKFILQISQFEKRFLPEKYHCISNLLLLRFMQITAYANMASEKDENRTLSLCMVDAMDGYMNNILDEEGKAKVIENIMKFLDMFIDRLAERYPDDVKPIPEHTEKDNNEGVPNTETK